MVIRFEEKAAFKIAGQSVHEGIASDFIGAWDDLYRKVSMADLVKIGSGECFGASYDFKTQDLFSYLAGYDVTDEARAKLLGLEILEVPAAKYLVLSLQGAIPQCIQSGWNYINGTYFPDSQFIHAGTPDFEFYPAGDPTEPDYQMELWIPIVEKNN